MVGSYGHGGESAGRMTRTCVGDNGRRRGRRGSRRILKGGFDSSSVFE